MSIENDIDDEKKIIYSRCKNVMSLQDFRDYIDRIWGDARYFGYNELFDTRPADWTDFDFSNLFVVAGNAAQLSTIDPSSKLAWVVLEGKQKALTDFYKEAKKMLPVSSRSLKSFYSEEDALDWLLD